MGYRNITGAYRREATLDRRVAAMVKDMGGWCIKLAPLHIGGLPDRLCLLPGGVCLFIEVKRQGGKPRRLQQYTHAKLRSLGFRVEVVDSIDKIEDIREWIESLLVSKKVW